VSDKPTWTFLTNHAHVLVCIAEEPDIRGREVAERVGISERAAQSIIAGLVADGYVTRRREGRRNRYTVHERSPLRHPIESDHTVGDLLVMLGRLRPRPDGRVHDEPGEDAATAVGSQETP
jgi:MarR family